MGMAGSVVGLATRRQKTSGRAATKGLELKISHGTPVFLLPGAPFSMGKT